MPLYGNLWGLRMDTKRILANGCPLCLDLSPCIARISPRVLLLTATRSVLDARSSTSFGNAPAWCSCCTSSRSFPMLRQPLGWGCTLTLSATLVRTQKFLKKVKRRLLSQKKRVLVVFYE